MKRGRIEPIGNIVLIVSNICLVFVTFFYVIETRNIRNITQKSFESESAPKIYINSIKTNIRHNVLNSEIYLDFFLEFINKGKYFEGKNLKISYELKSGEEIIRHGENMFVGQYLFPEQITLFPIPQPPIVLNLNKEKKEKLIRLSTDLGTKINVTKYLGDEALFKKGLEFKGDFSYYDHNDDLIKTSFSYKYSNLYDVWAFAPD